MLYRIRMCVMDTVILIRVTEHWIYLYHSTNCFVENICVEPIVFPGQNTPIIDL